MGIGDEAREGRRKNAKLAKKSLPICKRVRLLLIGQLRARRGESEGGDPTFLLSLALHTAAASSEGREGGKGEAV